jgi:hypothetical protein
MRTRDRCEVPTARTATTCIALVAALGALVGCGSSASHPQAGAAARGELTAAAGGCAATVLATLGHVLERVYGEGLAGEAAGSARHLVASSAALRAALASGDGAAALRAAHQLIATGHMTNITVTQGGKVLVDAGGPAMTPLRGELGAPGGAKASYVTSVFSDQTFIDEANGITQGLIVLRSGDRVVLRSTAARALTGATPANSGELTRRGVRYRYVSFPAQAFPSGPLRVYLFKPVSSTAPLCRRYREQTVLQTLRAVANHIYEGESGPRALVQVRRTQRDGALLGAVARRDPVAARKAIVALLNQHIVRMRVTTPDGALLDDVGGPDVLAPLHAPLRQGGRTIGEVELSVQDDEGYKRLVKRLAGLEVVMAANGKVVKNSLGPLGTAPPAHGSYEYNGRGFNVFTVNAQAFPSGPLTVRVLVPDPYL